MSKQGRFYLTPINLGIVGAYLTYIYCLARPYAVQFLIGGLVAALVLIFGPSMEQLGHVIAKIWNWVSGLVWSIIPKTAIGAGVAAIVAAFAFLGLGAAVSLRRRPPAPPSEAQNVGAPPDSAPAGEDQT
jgi:hypothetical protein